jgi:hypothetical protein
MKYDLFISHAHEDKRLFVDPLARALKDAGYKVWYDAFALQPGRSLRREIDEGLLESAVGVVVLSPMYFHKEWAQRELDALTSQEIADSKLVIPIWLNITRDEVAGFSPLLAARGAILAERGFDYVLGQLTAQINATDKCADRELEGIVHRLSNGDADDQRFLECRCLANFSSIVGYNNAYERKLDEIVDQFEDADGDDLSEVTDRLMGPWREDTRKRFDIPAHVYLDSPRALSREDAEDFDTRLIQWCRGDLSQFYSAALMYDFDKWLDADHFFILFSIPNFRVSPAQREVLNQAVIDVGSRALGEAPIRWSELYQRVMETR